MKSLKVLDVTLRDGGCVNNFNFGQKYMENILMAQENAGIDIIEVGYIDEKNGTEMGRSQYVNEKVIPKCILKNKKSQIIYVAMIDYGKYNIDNLKYRTQDGIDGIRLAFHKKDIFNAMSMGEKIIAKGYQLFIQPMVTFQYNDMELLELISLVNKYLSKATAFYIVDSFGEMRPNDISRIMSIVDHNLVSSMAVGLHSHNNLQLSYSNACALLQYQTNRDIILDSSIMGMGKGAGNLNTELLLEHLNLYYEKRYEISPLLAVIDKIVSVLYAEFHWGYAPEYYLSSANHCTPSYASHFYDKHMLSIEQVGELLSKLDEQKKNSFDKAYAEDLYREYNKSKSVDDKAVVKEFKKIFNGKKVLLVAPGKSVCGIKEKIKEVETKKSEFLVVGLNLMFDINCDYVLTTRADIFEKNVFEGKNVIVPSNVSRIERKNVKVINYSTWIEEDDEETQDSSTIIAINLLKVCGVKDFFLAGFDGFSIDINENYYDPNMRHPIKGEQITRNNDYLKKFFKKIMKEGIRLKFITPTKY